MPRPFNEVDARYLTTRASITAYISVCIEVKHESESKERQKMAIVLAIVIAGWLIAFALGAQAGFENEPAAVAEPVSVAKTEKAAKKTQPATYRKSISAS